MGAPSESAWAEADVVEVVDSAFQPSRAKVPHGASLTFTNRGEGVHTVTLQREGAFTFLEDRNLYPGEAVEVNFTEPGLYLLRCKVHSPDFEQGMVGRVMVD